MSINEDSNFAQLDRDPHFVPTIIPQQYNPFVVPSDSSILNATTMDIFRDELATNIALAWNN